MKFISTRNKNLHVDGMCALTTGIAPDGGLFVPEVFPKISLKKILDLIKLEYHERAAFVIGHFLDEFSQDELTEMCRAAYLRFDGAPAPIKQIDGSLYALELWHGATSAFKDIALSLLPYLLVESKRRIGDKTITHILTATSGDTGKAALEGFRDVEGTLITVLYPNEGVSPLQKLQMTTQAGDNVRVIGIDGNFDDAQTAVKNIFADAELNHKLGERGITLSSANSINIGRLLPQIVYYFSAYADLLLQDDGITIGEPVNFCVPSGNFGNILAGYYAKMMGLPINRLICASNKNNVLTDFFMTGDYDSAREFFKTSSPSMDILISSNLERLIFELSGRNDVLTAKRMRELKQFGQYSITENECQKAQETFFADYAGDDEAAAALGNCMAGNRYLTDPHTAVGLAVYNKYLALTDDETTTVLISTASPAKFVTDVLAALRLPTDGTPLKQLERLELFTDFEIPHAIASLERAPVLHSRTIAKKEINARLKEILLKD